jgi:hypothetical protein
MVKLYMLKETENIWMKLLDHVVMKQVISKVCTDLNTAPACLEPLFLLFNDVLHQNNCFSFAIGFSIKSLPG